MQLKINLFKIFYHSLFGEYFVFGQIPNDETIFLWQLKKGNYWMPMYFGELSESPPNVKIKPNEIYILPRNKEGCIILEKNHIRYRTGIDAEMREVLEFLKENLREEGRNSYVFWN